MLDVNGLAVFDTLPITTKTGFRTLIKTDPGAVKIIPVAPTPFLVSAQSADALPPGVPVTVHVGKTTAVIERKVDGKIVIR